MSIMEPLIPTINAFASIVVPADPLGLVSSLAVPDVAAGDLARPTVGDKVDPFGRQIVRMYSLGEKLNPFAIFDTNEASGYLFFNELDLQAQALGAANFAALYVANPGAATGIVVAFLTATVTPIQPAIPTANAAYVLYFRAQQVVKLTYAANFPEHRVRTSLLGYGDGNPIYSDPADFIAASNNRPPATGGSATFLTFDDYAAWWAPLRDTLEQQFALALLEWQNTAPSNAAWAALLVTEQNGSIMAIGS